MNLTVKCLRYHEHSTYDEVVERHSEIQYQNYIHDIDQNVYIRTDRKLIVN